MLTASKAEEEASTQSSSTTTIVLNCSSSSSPSSDHHNTAQVSAAANTTNNNNTSTTSKRNKRKRKNKSLSNNNSTSTSNNISNSTNTTISTIISGCDQLVVEQQPHKSIVDHQHATTTSLPLTITDQQQTSKLVKTSKNKSSSSNNNTQQQQQQQNKSLPPLKQAYKKNKQQQGKASPSSKNSTIVATTTTTTNTGTGTGGANSKAGSLRGTNHHSVVDKRRKGYSTFNKEIHVQESKSYSPSHRQLLKKVRTKVSTINFSQVVKYKYLESENQQELTMKKTSIINMAEIANLMNRRAQYLMKYIGFKTEKTCFFDVNDEIGYILHEHVAEVKKELTENNGKYVEKDVKVNTLNGKTISMNDESQMSKLVDQILHSYISNYMVCPSCKSIKTTNPIVVDNDQQQRILQEYKDDNNDVSNLTEYQEEQLIERLDDFTFFTIQCRDCDHKERIDNANSSDEFIKQILKSRQRNLSKLFKQGSNYQNEENYAENVLQTMYGYPPPLYYYPYYVELMPGDHNVYAPPYYPPPMPYGYSFYPTQPLYSPHYDIAANQESNEIIERDPIVEQNYKSAGVIGYAIHQGKVYFLLGKENRGGKGDVDPNLSFEKGISPYKIAKQMYTWSEFGGKKEKSDTNSAETAAREFYEETKAAFGDIYEKLSASEGYYFENGKYNLFITELEYLTNDEIQERSTIDSSTPYTEKVDLAWIDAEELMTRINDRTKQYFHAESGLLKIPVNGNVNEFLHPFALSLFRFANKTLAKLIASIKN